MEAARFDSVSPATSSNDVEARVARLRSIEDGPRAFFDVVSTGSAAIPHLDAFLRGPSESVPQPRRLAAEALGAIGNTAAREVLLAALSDCGARRLDPVLRLAEDAVLDSIAEQLAKLGEHRAVEPLLSLLQQRFHRGCVQALGLLGDREAIPTLVAALRDDFSRGAALAALRRFGPEATPDISRALVSSSEHGLEGSSSIEGRCAAVDLIAEFCGPPLPLAWALFDRERAVRTRAALALARTTGATLAAALVLLDALSSLDWPTLESVYEALLHLGSELPALLNPIIAQSGHPLQQIRAVELLGRVGDVSRLASLISHPEDLVRSAAAAALGGIAEAGTTDLLRAFLEDTAGEVRLAAIRALAPRNALSLVRIARLLMDSDPRVRRAGRGLLPPASSRLLRKLWGSNVDSLPPRPRK